MLYIPQRDPWDNIWDDEWLTPWHCWKSSGMEFEFYEIDFRKLYKERHNKLVRKLNSEL